MPYSWDNDNDYTAKSKKGYSFKNARKSYDDIAIAKTSSKAFYTYKNDFLKTDAEYPIIIGIDTTGSMDEWPKIFFNTLPLLYKEAIKYFPNCEISFQAINDFPADGADVALQPTPFGKGPQLDEFIGQLYPYGGGGGQTMESYEIFAAYNSFIEAPKALIKPIVIILGDEKPFPEVPAAVCKYYKLSNGEAISTKEVFKKLHQKCEVFLVRKPYYGFGKADDEIRKVWHNLALMPYERILDIEDPRRVIDVILGILGILTNKTVIFEDELTKRQNKKQTTEVLNALSNLKTYNTQHSITANMKTKIDITQKTEGLDIDE